MQREINAFIVESFGRFLIPGLLNAIRREHDPNFKEEDLERLLRSYFPNPGPATLRDQVPASTPLPVIAASMPWGTPAAEPSPQAPSPELGSLDFTEEIIRIIMEATGYERDEIEPDMDLRLDLGIRSSRLPVIMDTAESRFGVQIRLEDFLEVRTVADLGQRIAQVVTAQKGQGPAPAVTAGAAVSAAPEKPPLSREEKALKRMVFEDLPLETGKAAPLGLQPGETVIILAPAEKSALSEELGAIFQQEYGVTPLPVTFLEETSGPETLGFDLRSPEGARRALKRLGEVPSLAGLVVVLDEELDRRLTGVEEVADLICGLFSPLKSLAASPQKKFALLIHQGEDRYDLKRVLAEGLLGMFLSAAQEYVSVKFRTVRADGLTDLKEVVGQALDRSLPVVETVYHQGELLTGAGRVTPGAFRDLPGLQLSSGDVVVFSGGGYGITTSLARCLAPFNPRIVLLGRTRIDLEPEIENTLKEGEPSEKSLRWQLMERSPEIPQEALDLEVARLLKARTVLKTLEDLRALGLEVAYFSCDVAEARQVDATLGEIIRRYGKIDGIIHGAGILRDGFLAQMTPQDVQAVTAVKFLGAWHLFNAAQKAGLRFMVGLSSGVAIQGNPGQTNYAAANRMMSALFSHLSRQHPDIVFKALMLPAVAETGMAAAPEIRHLLEKMNVGYIQPEELAELFLRELFLSPPEEVWVLFMRTLPEVKSVRLDFSEPPPAPGEIRAGTVAFSSDNFPLVDAVSLLDLHKGEIRATRAFSRERDLWIEDHKPFKFLKHPLVSTIMALEAFMETSRLLFPYLRVRGVREARFLEIVACPPGVVREAEITCRRMEAATGEVVCELSMETPEISPAGRVLDCSSVNYRAQVILGADAAVLEELPGFPLQPGELDTRPLDHQEVLEWYRKRSDMQDRYRVMEDLDGTGPQVIRGRTIYRAGKDFTTPPAPDFQYSPYLLEALLQLAAFYVVMRDEEEPRSLIPVRIGEMTFSRKCRDQERITVEARMTAEDQEGLTWDAMALDEEGRAIMQVRDLRLNWFSD
jgi:NAD(P)-dependent dehydrogenase (short-subunit alcohol dehydrogenase family)/acyl carrier protein